MHVHDNDRHKTIQTLRKGNTMKLDGKLINCIGMMKTVVPFLPTQINIINGTMVVYHNEKQYHFRNSDDGLTVHMEVWEEGEDGSVVIEQIDIDETMFNEYIEQIQEKNRDEGSNGV